MEAAIVGAAKDVGQVAPVLQATVVDEALNLEVRLWAIRALGMTETDDADGILRGLAENTDTTIATEAGYALERIRARDYR